MREYHVLNLGAGVQSTCLYLLSRAPESPWRFDVAIFADTGEEPAAVYAHLRWLCGLGTPAIWVRRAGRLGDDLQRGRGARRRCASIPAFTAPDHRTRPSGPVREGRLPRQCTREYKVEVVERAIRRELVGLRPRQPMPRDVVVTQYFGITVDEAGRAERRFAGVRWTRPVYPFLELGWTRQDCQAWLRERVPHPVPRSACVFCPFHSNREWVELKQADPADWARAVALDRALRQEGNVVRRGLEQQLYLHRSCRPLEEIDFAGLAGEALHPMHAGECEGVCGV
ncbi:MAG: hypothetical protein L0Z62_19460 [Gemmataceae bacterium]|nr:hypothetical protein [Gemmataceae bacterium]